MVAKAEYLLAMKCLALRIGAESHDEDDIRYLLRTLDIGSYEQALAGEFVDFHEGQSWGRAWDTMWLEVSCSVPEQWQDLPVVAEIWLSDPDYHDGFGREGLIWHEGRVLDALNRFRSSVRLRELFGYQQHYRFYVEAAANVNGPYHFSDAALNAADFKGPELFYLKKAELALFNPEAFDLQVKFRCASEALLQLEQNSPRFARLLQMLNAVCDELVRSDLEPGERITAAAGLLAQAWQGHNASSTLQICAVGHAHIDTAWMWPLRESMRKCARTFSAALRYMALCDDYRFSASSAQHYAWIKQHYPELYARIKQFVARGNWEYTGAMWVEADCNLPGGESLIRQLLHGNNFFLQEFGRRCKVLWLPDCFGYCSQLPQILRKAGVEYFMTQKISWNDTNQFPHHSFLWQGIDGSSILSHFPPANTYNAHMSAAEIKSSERNFREAQHCNEVLLPYGYGDGGGGPSLQQIHSARAFADFEGLPRLHMGRIDEFFERMEQQSARLPVWSGELYLELHRGTLTSQAALKRANRKAEYALYCAELLQAFCRLHAAADLQLGQVAGQYPLWDVEAAAAGKQHSVAALLLDRCWKGVLLNQFHDIIPGSSINRVYREAAAHFELINANIASVTASALAQIAACLPQRRSEDYLLVNPHAFACEELLQIEGKSHLVALPPFGYRLLAHDSPASVCTQACGLEQQRGLYVLQNRFVRIELLPDGRIGSWWDKVQQREFIQANAFGNQWQLFEDHPNFWNAWDIDAFSLQAATCKGLHDAHMSIECRQDCQLVLRLKGRLGLASTLDVLIRLQAHSPRLEFECVVDWQERNRLLKTAFPLDLHGGQACYESQFAILQRPTHANTGWDQAKFELPAHNWVALCEGQAGFVLGNDCKYGYDVQAAQLRLTLLKGATAPDPLADVGEHRFSYYVRSFSGSLQQAGVVEEGRHFNQPLLCRNIASLPLELAVKAAELPEQGTLLDFEAQGSVVSAVKLSEDARGVVLRYYEAYGSRQPLPQVKFPGNAKLQLQECDLNEEYVQADVCEYLKPFEIRSYRAELP